MAESGRGMGELRHAVLAWAKERGLFEQSDSKIICLKAVSEMGELADDVIKGEDIRDELGDVLICLTVLAHMNETTLLESFQIAFNKIKDRRGVTIGGVFIRDEES